MEISLLNKIQNLIDDERKKEDVTEENISSALFAILINNTAGKGKSFVNQMNSHLFYLGMRPSAPPKSDKEDDESEEELEDSDELEKVSRRDIDKSGRFAFTVQLNESKYKTVKCVHVTNTDEHHYYYFTTPFINALLKRNSGKALDIGAVPCPNCHKINRMVEYGEMNKRFTAAKTEKERTEILAETDRPVPSQCKQCKKYKKPSK